MSRKINITGQKFGRLQVVEQRGKDKWNQTMWFCKCDCGNERVVASNNLRNGHYKSCGCIKTEKLIKRFTKHNHTNRTNRFGNKCASREYYSWQGMKKRCLDPTHIYYSNYGGRGITICDRWVNSFKNFFSDMGERPARYSIDRIDSNGNYEPSNCRWASSLEQARNKRRNKNYIPSSI